MSPTRTNHTTPLSLMVLIAVQAVCAIFFLSDLIADFGELGGAILAEKHLVIEAIATLSLIAAIAIELRLMLRLLRREADLVQSLGMARAAVQEVIEAHFDAWKLSPSERDVANFLVKGLSISEMAELRGNAEGTIKAHLNAICRKSGTHNRAELMSILVDAMMGAEAGETPGLKAAE
ncbi:helix-turn-helix transcriptional regulator [Marimonas lutisalis]|uniref:helix-turn-helix transcriptional regulator n=1 Tax=Marimonas lutisalis TaxID=2545756 RepID=UPI0010F9D4A4|nr:helix-turn-helix transcriptional regulator [Marimonas lutisalis]